MSDWNPLATVEPVTLPLDVAGVLDDGSPRATITLARWSGRQRLAYEDAITSRMLTTDERDGSDTVKIGTLRLFATSLTVVGCSGFPSRADGSPLFTARPGMDLRSAVEADLLALDGATFAEIRDKAMKVQPLPSSDDGDGDENAKDDADEAEAPDPFPTPSTSPIETAGGVG